LIANPTGNNISCSACGHRQHCAVRPRASEALDCVLTVSAVSAVHAARQCISVCRGSNLNILPLEMLLAV
jgi:hypothetical protein